jgi:lysophospholipase L1-like esterase
LNGRTTVWEDPVEPHRNGSVYLPPCLLTHRPFDLITVMLGTNDLKMRFSAPARDISAGAGLLVDMVQQSIAGIADQPPQVLLIAPPPVAPLAGTPYADMFVGAEEKSQQLAAWYRAVAEERGCAFMNAGDVIESSPVDAIHFEADAHRKLGAAIAAKVREIVG